MPCVFVPAHDNLSAEGRSSSIRIEYTEHGEGPVLAVLVPGMCVPSTMYNSLASRLASDGRFTALCVENRGMKGSGWAAGGWTASRLAADAWAVVDAVRKAREIRSRERVAVIGHSMGGMVAQRMAAQRPSEVGLLACISTHAGGSWNLMPSRGLLAALIRLAWNGFKPHARAAVTIGLHFTDSFVDGAARRRADLMQRYLTGASEDFAANDADAASVNTSKQASDIALRGHLSVVRSHSLSYFESFLLADCRRILKVVIAGRADCVVVPSSSRRLAHVLDADMVIEVEGAHFIIEEAEQAVISSIMLALNLAFGPSPDGTACASRRCECYTCNPGRTKKISYLKTFRMC